MELPDIPFNKAEYIETASGNRVSRASVLCGSQNIILNGKNIVQSEAIIRGDLANVRVGRHCVISSKAVIRPPFKKFIAIGAISISDGIIFHVKLPSFKHTKFLDRNCSPKMCESQQNFGKGGLKKKAPFHSLLL